MHLLLFGLRCVRLFFMASYRLVVVLLLALTVLDFIDVAGGGIVYG